MTEITIQELGQKIYDLPAGKSIHFKRFEDRDLFGVTRLDIFDCDTILISYYGGLNTSVFDATVDYSPKDLAYWVQDVIELDGPDPVFFMQEKEVLPHRHELWGVTFRVTPDKWEPYRTLAISEIPLFYSQEEAEKWIEVHAGFCFDTAFPIEICDEPKAVLIDSWMEEKGFISSDDPDQKYATWQRGEAEMHIASIELINRETGERSSGADEIFYDRKSALAHIVHYFDDDGFVHGNADCYFECSIRLFTPPLEERKTYLNVKSLFDLSDWFETKPYYTQTVNK